MSRQDSFATVNEFVLKNNILKVVFELLVSEGLSSLSFSRVAQLMKVEESEIMKIFPSLEFMISNLAEFKMSNITVNMDSVMELDIPIINKFAKYLEVIHSSTSEASSYLVQAMSVWREELSDTMNEYLKKAVYGRFTKLLEEAERENKLKEGIVMTDALYKYWEMLSGILAVNPSAKAALEMISGDEIGDKVCNLMLGIFKDVLNDDSLKELKSLIRSSESLSGLSI